MCGIAGILHATPSLPAARAALAEAMADQLRHRGPDGSGVWTETDGAVALAHRRLAIVDLSDEGRQPMVSASGRYVLVLNGEIYNHRALRDALTAKGHAFRGRSDTEAFVESVDEWGPEEALRRSVGMFAFAIWDRRERVAWLARDRMGEKPLYYARVGGQVIFGSELKAIRAHPEFEPQVDLEALGVLMRLGYVPAPFCIYRGVRKLPPGGLLRLSSAADADSPPEHYWSLADVAVRGARQPFGGDRRDASAEVERRLRAAVRDQMVADVPLGAFLSGGIDSSTVVALMQKEASRPVRTFTVGFDDPAFDEAPHARAVARHLGTDHTEMRVTAADALAVVPLLPTLYDEPMADYSQLPTYLVAKLTREHVTVSLSADGGDELFGGYNTYRWAPRLFGLTRGVPRWARHLVPRLVGELASPMTRAARLIGRPALGHRVLRALGLAEAEDPLSLFRQLTVHWEGVPWPLRASGAAGSDVRPLPPGAIHDPRAAMRYTDAVTYMPGDVLVKVDRASMAVSLESRAPLLDHRLVEFAFTLPSSLLWSRSGVGKQPLRDVLFRHVPRRLVDRPKKGFSPPLGAWLRGPLRPWAEDLLDPTRLAGEGFFDPDVVQRVWEEHVTGLRDWKYLLWDVLSFQAWWREHL